VAGKSYYECRGLEQQLAALAKKYGEIPGKVYYPAAKRALNKAAGTCRKEVAQGVAAAVNAKVNQVRRRIKIHRARKRGRGSLAKISAKLSFVVSDLSSAHLKNFRQVKAGVKTKRGLLAGKFVMRNLKHSKRVIAGREGGRLEFYKVPIGDMGARVIDRVAVRRGANYVAKYLDHEIKWRLDKYWRLF
jgi:hypothetical protein